MATQLCVDFLVFPDNHPIPSGAFVGPFKFTGNGLFVNVSGGGKGLQFQNAGVKIRLPVPATKVRLKIGQFAAPIVVTLLGTGGAVVATQTLNSPNSYHIYQFGPFTPAKRVRTIVLKDGGNEGLVAQICEWF